MLVDHHMGTSVISLSYSTMRDQPSVLMVGQQVIETICYFPNLPNYFPLFFSFFTNGDVGFSFTICYWWCWCLNLGNFDFYFRKNIKENLWRALIASGCRGEKKKNTYLDWGLWRKWLLQLWLQQLLLLLFMPTKASFFITFRGIYHLPRIALYIIYLCTYLYTIIIFNCYLLLLHKNLPCICGTILWKQPYLTTGSCCMVLSFGACGTFDWLSE